MSKSEFMEFKKIFILILKIRSKIFDFNYFKLKYIYEHSIQIISRSFIIRFKSSKTEYKLLKYKNFAIKLFLLKKYTKI